MGVYRNRHKNKKRNKRLIMARIDKDYSQDELASIVGVSRQTIGVIEAGSYNASLNVCMRICVALDSDPNTMFWEQWKEKKLH